MRILRTDDPNLQGKQLASSVYSADGHILLRKGVYLTPNYIKLLSSRGYHSVYVENELLPGLEIDEAINQATRIRATELVRKALEKTHKGEDLVIEPISRAVDAILDDLAGNSDMVVQLSTLRSIDEYSFVHSVNVCVLSVLMGYALHYPPRDMKQLGIGAILHDLGKARVPPEYLKRDGALTPSEYEEVKNHTTEGFELLRQNRDISILSAHVAFQHHERMDGSGYPRQLKGDDILEFARIAAVADVWDALISDRPYRKCVAPEEAMKELKQGAGKLYDETCVHHLMSRLAVYPVGTIVLLSDRRLAVVTKQGTKSHRPYITIVADCEHKLVAPSLLSLEESQETSILQALQDYPPSVVNQINQIRDDSYWAASGYRRT